MRTIFIVLVLQLMPFIFIKAQTADSTLKVCCIKETYSSCEKINFIVINNTTKKLYLAIALEEYFQNNWIKIANDIFNEDFSKSRQIIFLDSLEHMDLVWDTGKFPLIKVEMGESIKENKLIGKFRLVLEYGFKYDCLNYKLRSNSFVLKK